MSMTKTVDWLAAIPVNDKTCPLIFGFRICLLPLEIVTFVMFRVKLEGKVMLMVSVLMMAVESLKVRVAVAGLLTVVGLIAKVGLVNVPDVIPDSFTLLQISIFPPVADSD